MTHQYKGERRFAGAYVPIPLWQLIDAEARRSRTSKSKVITEALAAYFDRSDLTPDTWAQAARDREQQESLPMTG